MASRPAQEAWIDQVNEPTPWAAYNRFMCRDVTRPLSILAMLLVVLLQPLSEYFGVRDPGRLLAKVVTLVAGVPLVGLLGRSTFRAATRRSNFALAFVLGGACASGLLFAGLLSAVRELSLHVALLHPRGGVWGRWDVVRIGGTMGMSTFALWALALILPRAARDARLRAAEIENLRARSELEQLRAQFTPHFLLNTLNATAGLLVDQPREARRLLASLGDLLRESMRSEDEMQTLAAQLEWLRAYASILQARHAGLEFRWQVAPSAARALLPRWILQPLVENAVEHGALKRRGGGQVTVAASLDDGKLVCTVEDNGYGFVGEASRPGAVGLGLVRRRLLLKYAEAASLRFDSSPSGTRAIVEIPYAG